MSQDRLTRRRLTKGLGLAGLTGLAGCSGNGGQQTTEPSDGAGTTQTTGQQTTGKKEPLKVAMVYTTAGLGDQGFNDSAHDGLMRAKEELGIKLTEAEPEGAEQYSTFLRQFAQQDYDLVCGLSFEMQTAMKQVAKDFPDQKFTIVDTSVKLPNVASYLYREHEGCYLVGIMNGLLTQREFQAGAGKTNTTTSVGFVGGKKNPVIEKFHAGYKAGIKSFDTSINLRSAYAGTWTSPSKGKSIAESMYNEGVDIVFPAAGATGLGVFQAAQEQGRFAVGVDKPQSKATPEYANVILGSMVKRVGEAFFRSIQNVMQGQFNGGEQLALGLEREGVDLVYGQQLGSKIPEDVKTAVAEARKKIIAGEIDVPSTLDS